jgi:hypothetical protein
MEAGSLAGAVERAAAIPRFRSLLVARHGRLVLERYFGGTQEGDLLDVRSVTKSVSPSSPGSPCATRFSLASTHRRKRG